MGPNISQLKNNVFVTLKVMKGRIYLTKSDFTNCLKSLKVSHFNLKNFTFSNNLYPNKIDMSGNTV